MENSETKSYILQREEILKSILKNIKNLDLSFILWIVPEERIYTFLRAHIHKIIKKILNTDCYIPPRIFTPKRLARNICSRKRVLAEFAVTRIIQALSDRCSTGYAVMLRDFMRELKMCMPDKSFNEIKEIVMDKINLLLIPERTSAEILKAIEIFEKYQSLLNEKEWLDPEDALIFASKLNYKSETLIIEGFQEPYNAEKILLKSLEENAKNKFLISYDGNVVKNAFLLPLKDTEQEIEEIAKRIKLKLINDEPSKTELYKYAVAVAGINKYLPKIIRIFNKYSIPVQIYHKKQAETIFPWNELIYLIESVSENFSRLKFLSFLHSNTMKNIPLSIKKSVSKLCLSLPEIRSKEDWLDPELLEDEILRKDFENSIKLLEPLFSIRENASISEYSEALKNILNKAGFLDYLKFSNDHENLKIFNKIFEYIQFLDEMLKPDFNKINLLTFIDILKDLINYYYKEQETCGVRIVDMQELYGIDAETVFIAGVIDEVLPLKDRGIQFVPENLKRELGMRDLTKEVEIEKKLFISTLSAIKEVIITYPLQEGDKYFLPSPYIAELPTIENLKRIILSDEELLLKHPEPIEKLLQEIKISKEKIILPEEISVTELEAYIKCPRKFFIEKLLKLEPPVLRLYKIDDRVFGKYAHRFMEALFKEKSNNFNEFTIKAELILDEILKTIRKPWKELLREEFINSFKKIWELEESLINEGMVSSEVEFPVKGVLSSLKLKGKIDRLIITEDGCILIDYKTGSQKLNCKQAMEGKDNIQLFLYAYLLSQLSYKVKKVGIISTKDFSPKWCPNVNTNGNVEQAIDAVEKSAESAIEKIKNAVFYTDLSSESCMRCLDYLCPKFHNLEKLKGLQDV